MRNQVDFKISGRFALFTDPLSHLGGEKCSYHLPTYEALKGIISSGLWKPTITWIVDRVRILNKIRTQAKSLKPLDYGGGNSLAIYTYLVDVEYQVQAHFMWNLNYPELELDRNEGKYFAMAKRAIEKGGRRDIFLGTRECQAYLEPCIFGEGLGYYDDEEELSYSLMFHGFDYPDETAKDELWARFQHIAMKRGVVEFLRPENCTVRRFVRTMKARKPTLQVFIGDECVTEGVE